MVRTVQDADRESGTGGSAAPGTNISSSCLRLVDAASGWHASDAGDILSSHSYPSPSAPNCSAPGMGSLSAPSDRRGHYALRHCESHVLMNSEFGGEPAVSILESAHID
eukprot:COSAG01_NODE_1664_length_9573_cov_31.637429_9_plen_109_part_00